MQRTLGTTKLKLVVLGILACCVVLSVVVIGVHHDVKPRAQTGHQDYTQFVNLIQGPGTPTQSDRQVFMRYPLGRIGLWSRDTGEIADSVTRNLRLYPLVDQTVPKDDTDWRGTITAYPAETDITYKASSPAKGSTVALTVTANVAIYKFHFNGAASFGAVGVTLGATHGGPSSWSTSLSVLNDQTMQATLVSGSHKVFYYVKFNVAGTGKASGSQGYMRYGPSTHDVIVAAALSQTSMNQAQQYFANQFAGFDFAAASQRLRDAWNAKLGEIDVQDADPLTKQMLYTGLYSVYANIVNATDGSPYATYAQAYGSPVLTVGSSIGWAYIGGGYFRCAFDQGRDIYYLLTLLDPPVMTDILHTYQAQYDRDHVLLGNWDPYTPSSWTDQQWGFWGGMFLRAKLMGVTNVDYKKAALSIADTFGNLNNMMSKSGYLSLGYIPADRGISNFMSRALEWSTDALGLALLAETVGDTAVYNQWIGRGKNYLNNWDAADKVFRARNADGSWAPISNAGFFEGTNQDYAFDVPQDPLGLADLYGDSAMTSKINSLLTPNRDYNDYMPGYRVLPIYSNSPSTAEDISRNRWLLQFHSLNMWEGWWPGSDVYYTHNAGDVVLAVLGLYPIQAPGAQWIITSPSVTTAVIHGANDITIQANNNSSSNVYISSIHINGAAYPSYFIAGETLVKERTTIALNMTNTPSRIGSMYVTGADGEILAADTDNSTYLRFQNDPLGGASRAKIYAQVRPKAVLANGQLFTYWTYDPTEHTLTMRGIPSGTVLIRFANGVNPPPVNTPAPAISPSP